jgi:phosphodiesterase/alkaline phosphatase D-like protein
LNVKNSFYISLLLFCWSCTKISQVPRPGLIYVWSGAPTTNSITIKFKTAGEQEARVYLHEREDFEDTVASTDIIKTKAATYFTGTANLKGLKPDKSYYYTLETDYSTTIISGSFKTFPEEPSSFTVAFGSCARTGSDSDIFATINNQDPLFYMNVGDFHYENINSNCSYNFAKAYFDILSSRYQRELYSSRPFIYIWDDHDYGANNSAADAPCREDALEAYRLFIPHYPLAFEKDKDPVSQSFVAGRVRFILTDLRSQKERPQYKGCERVKGGTNFGNKKHLEWFQGELLDARENGQIVAWVNSIPWIVDTRSPEYECDEKDDWSGYPEERTEIANFIKENNITIFILSGDAHMLAIDDGSNSDYATGGGAPIPVFHAAPLDQVGILKGGPYSQGYSRKRGQFGLLEIEDNGGEEICITFKGMNSDGNLATNINGHPLVYSFCEEIF